MPVSDIVKSVDFHFLVQLFQKKNSELPTEVYSCQGENNAEAPIPLQLNMVSAAPHRAYYSQIHIQYDS